MLFAILVCSDVECDAVYEAWGEPKELESIACELCGCVLDPMGFSEVGSADERPTSLEVQLRDAA
jgi:hypothetical protein